VLKPVAGRAQQSEVCQRRNSNALLQRVPMMNVQERPGPHWSALYQLGRVKPAFVAGEGQRLLTPNDELVCEPSGSKTDAAPLFSSHPLHSVRFEIGTDVVPNRSVYLTSFCIGNFVLNSDPCICRLTRHKWEIANCASLGAEESPRGEQTPFALRLAGKHRERTALLGSHSSRLWEMPPTNAGAFRLQPTYLASSRSQRHRELLEADEPSAAVDGLPQTDRQPPHEPFARPSIAGESHSPDSVFHRGGWRRRPSRRSCRRPTFTGVVVWMS